MSFALTITSFSLFFFLSRNRIRMYPAFVNCTTIDWFHEWPQDALLEVADRSLVDMDLGGEDNVSWRPCSLALCTLWHTYFSKVRRSCKGMRGSCTFAVATATCTGRSFTSYLEHQLASNAVFNVIPCDSVSGLPGTGWLQKMLLRYCGFGRWLKKNVVFWW